ncbi:unnamed protein product [Chondrus crispus]|uniref:Uncharacterized protein n=1 Tax=Chondrus crispus TaxID=2769 RepID=R7QJM6_CHOCR|nr:unnamed protein product [Chondrus crispus]CDF37671.1 unnamed protein product [Chondrus crispus]|eukprot:XP_005717542.1 unnamed protein product [Chondrus crispus]
MNAPFPGALPWSPGMNDCTHCPHCVYLSGMLSYSGSNEN